MTQMTITALLLLILSGSAAAQQVDTTGTGWRLATLDLDVTVLPGEKRLEVAAEMVLRLADHDRSRRVVVVINSRDSTMALDSVRTAQGVVRDVNGTVPGRSALRRAVVDIAGPALERGAVLRVRVFASSRVTINQFTLAEDVALASWVTGWYPVPLPPEGGGLSTVNGAPGETRFDMPEGWHAVSNGVRTASRTMEGRTRETWETRQPVGRSFSAAPYRLVAGETNGRRVELFLLTVSDADAHVQANALAGAIAALERRFGPYPTGSYAIAEVPEWVPGFLASSEQGFMMTKPETFNVPGGNIPLFAHEAAHGYWGNLVTSSGPGASFLTEAIAQYGAVIALEEMLGPEAAVDFLKFSREGYILNQSARGYFEVIRRGADSVAIGQLQNLSGTAKRIVIDSKGTWIYAMLRQRMGDDRFFSALRAYLEAHTDGSSTLGAFREAMARAAPEAGLEEFFAQWLDRTGAPRLEVTWTRVNNEVQVVVTQVHEGDPYTLDVDLLVEGANGERQVQTVKLSGRRGEFRLSFPGTVEKVTLDPDFKILRWDEVYTTGVP
jgi:hypothetical protein